VDAVVRELSRTESQLAASHHVVKPEKDDEEEDQ